MKRHKYSSHREYVTIQEKWNKAKLDRVWVKMEFIQIVANYIREHLPEVHFGICHGTRRGAEQEWLRKELGCEVIGTEISSTATQFPNTIQWDFHEIKAEWVGAVDFIYSNSLDHAHNPELAVGQWMKCLKPGGLCFIDWSEWDHGESHVNDLDCFGASIVEMRTFLKRFSKDVVELPVDPEGTHVIFVLKA